ncbi:adenylate kinase 7 isoform X2 [Nilaparvata lugens]|uniref:adenylate kinase 7 isoform X2 n=1 Tax=Nilaparvata lugens TaxID=108931 RepID=UPI00193D7F52|nr:adenylate kinase 7 isoform X2 [Nilaparvata lugens]
MEGDLPGNILKTPLDSDRDFFLHDFYAQDTSINTVIDLDEYFKYRRNNEDDDDGDGNREAATKEMLFVQNLVFINNIDSYNGKYIAQLLPKLEETYADQFKIDNEDSLQRSIISSMTGEDFEENLPPDNKEQEAEQQEKRSSLKSSLPYQIEHLEDMNDPFNEYEYMDALYSMYDVGKLTTLEYAELLQFETDAERLAFLESKFSKLKRKENGIDKIDGNENDDISKKTIEADKKKIKQPFGDELKFIATLKDPVNKEAVTSLPNVLEVVNKDESDRKEFKDTVSKCGVFIIDISDCHGEVEVARSILNVIMSRLQSIKEWSPKKFEEMSDTVTFILISTLMTWSETPPLDPEEPDEPLTEKMFTKRRYHPNYLDHYNLEREVLAAAKRMQGKFNAVIISAGVIYGYEQSTLHYLFKSAWLDEGSLPVFGRGSNPIPLIHIDDLTKIIHFLMHNNRISKFVFAVESVAPTLKEITKAVSSTLGSSKIKRVTEDLVFRISEISQEAYEKLLTKLNVESALVGDDKEISIEFKYPTGFIDAIKTEVETFKKCRGLKAIKLLVLGPPGCGRTKVCRALSNYYKINYLSAETAVEMYKQKLQATINEIELSRLEREVKKSVDNEVTQEEEDESVENEEESIDKEVDEEEEEEMLQKAKSKLAAINDSLALNNGQLDGDKLAKIMKEILLTTACQNQGYVLDGFPETLKQTKILFSSPQSGDSEEDEEEGDEDDESEEKEDDEEGNSGSLEDFDIDDVPKRKFNKKTVPNEVFCLEASDDFLYQTLLRNSEDENQELSEKDIVQQVSTYREMNADNGILLFFDELEIYPHILNIENDITPNMCVVTRKLMTLIGKTANYESETLEQLLKASREAQLKQREEIKQAKDHEFKKLKDDLIREKLERWAADVDRMKEEEEEILIKESLPARHYLMKFVLPTLTKGLIEVARVKPNDPIDYLAEYIFTNNEDHRNFYKIVQKAQFEAMKTSGTMQDSIMS